MVSMARFSGKGVIVTGGLGGIGRAVARRFAAEGAALMLIDLADEDGGSRAELSGSGASEVLYQPCDVSDEQAVVAAAERAARRFGSLDVIVNVAGAMIYRPIEELTGADWQRLISVNFLGAAYLTGAGFRLMNGGGAIVNIASVHALQTSPQVAPYAAAKAALTSLTRSAAIEGRSRGIRANAILPGAIDTAMLRASPNVASGVEVFEPGDVGRPEDVAAAALFLASDDARFITGECLRVDGGRLARL
ncbi:MAG TPA: SDR family oxidoreductase [Sphingomonas sp.]|nr:SDR family oxidoreductase [Sphingomonas sp.]